jgi:rhodanese-related sulfurtransferase
MKIAASQLQQSLHAHKNITLIDVRTPIEYEEMHMEGAHLMSLDGLDPAAVKTAFTGSEQCVLICQSGKRSDQAFQKLQAAGCEKLLILDGGILAWEAAGLPLIRSARKILPLMRQVQLTIGIILIISSALALTVNKNFTWLPAFLGCGLTLAGSTGWCGLAILLSRMPWNQSSCSSQNVKSCSL